MSDFLKNIKKSLESGQTNEEVVKHHYDVLHGADVVDNLNAAKKAEVDDYNNQLLGYAFPSTTEENEQFLINTIASSNDNAYVDDVFEFSNTVTREQYVEKIQKANDDAKIYEEKRKKQELIELNSAHIILLETEIKEYELKILKNKDLIEYLKTEIERTR